MATAPLPKRQKLDGPLIGTHNGHFHADEALAVYLLRLLPTYADSPLVRTRDPATLSTCHTVVDVGGEYDIPRNRYDHHQRDFSTTFPKHSTKLSSAGLVFMHFGKAIIAQRTGLATDSEEVTRLYEKLYDDFIEAFDANDNGISAYDPAELRAHGISKRFNDRGFSLASVVGRLNYRHDELAAPPPAKPAAAAATASAATASAAEDKAAPTPEQLQEAEDSRFALASQFTGSEFLAELADAAGSWLPARRIVADAYTSRHKHHPSGSILVLPYRKEGLPWSDHLFSIEAEAETEAAAAAAADADATPTDSLQNGRPHAAQVLYVLFPESAAADAKWRIRAVPLSADGGFENRKALPEAWRGVRDELLDEVAGVDGCVFVHASGFIGGNRTFDGALAMATKAVAM